MPPNTSHLAARLAALVGSPNVAGEGPDQAPYLHEWRGLYEGRALFVVKPGTTDEVAAVVALAHELGIGIVPQAGNTGLVGGQIPDATGREIVLTVERLRKVRSVDPAGFNITAEAGVTLAEVQRAASAVERLFPLGMASEGSCRIGGNLATNAGGIAVLAHGTARDLVLGIEVVLADGRIWNGLKSLRKDNTGYDLKNLFIGSEGTLGVITAATLKLVAKPAETATALVAVRDLGAVPELFARARRLAGPELTAFEFIARIGLELVARHIERARLPFALEAPWYVLLDIASPRAYGEAESHLLTIVEESLDLVTNTAVAASVSQSRDLWSLRHALSEAQKREGGSIKHDISVPIAAIPEFVVRAGEAVAGICLSARPVVFGHFGDGNIHYNVSQPREMETARFLDLWTPMTEAVHALAVEMGGSISAEHGIGQLKRDALTRMKSAVELDLMRRIKAALDPKGIMNPGKLL